MSPSPILIDLTNEFVSSPIKSEVPSPVRERLAAWSPSRPESVEDVENKINTANERRQESLVAKQEAVKADAVKSTTKIQTARQLFQEHLEEKQEHLNKKQENAAQRALEIQRQATEKAKRHHEQVSVKAKTAKLQVENKVEETLKILTKKQETARERAQENRSMTVQKARMVGSRVEKVKAGGQQDTGTARKELERKQVEAQARADEAKVLSQTKAKKMAQPRLDEVRASQDRAIEFTREVNEARHAEAQARVKALHAEVARKAAAMASPSKGEAAKQRFEQSRAEKKEELAKRMVAAETRVGAIRQQVVQKAVAMSSPPCAKQTSSAASTHSAEAVKTVAPPSPPTQEEEEEGICMAAENAQLTEPYETSSECDHSTCTNEARDDSTESTTEEPEKTCPSREGQSDGNTPSPEEATERGCVLN